MGNGNTKSSLRKAIVLLNISADSIEFDDEKFWNQIWLEDVQIASEVIKCTSLQEIRMLRDGSPKSFATLTYKMVDRLQYTTTSTLCNTSSQQKAVLNAIRILTRLLPCIFEDTHWRNFFIENKINLNGTNELKFPAKINRNNFLVYIPSSLQSIGKISLNQDNSIEHSCMNETDDKKVDKEAQDFNLLSLNSDDNLGEVNKTISIDKNQQPSVEPKNYDNSLMKCLIISICDLLFCPEFTVLPYNDKYLDNSVDGPPEDLKALPSCEYVWEPGVGFDLNINSTKYYDKSRADLLRLLLTCLSSILYQTPKESLEFRNVWMEIFASDENRHVLPLFTSLLNTIFTYKPSGKITPFSYLLSGENRKELVELCVQLMIANLDDEFQDKTKGKTSNLFVEYISRIHRAEDLNFLIQGFARLLNNCLEQNYLVANSTRYVNFEQELLILFWKISILNSKFVSFLLKTNDILDIVVPILHHMNENFQEPTKTGLIHIGVFNLLILSGERNFGVRLNKPYLANVLLNLPTFTGSHADLLIIVLHKLMLYGQNLNQLFDHLLTIIVNISPYIKALSILASKCLIQLFEIFSSAFVVFTEPNYHKLVVFLLEIFNNIIQYQFDGNANLVYIILSKKEAFHNLANLPATSAGIEKVLKKLIKKKKRQMTVENAEEEDKSSNKTKETSNNQIERSRATVSDQSLILGREVCLTETPEICLLTKLTHTSENNGGANLQAEGLVKNTQTKLKEPSISFDDILNDDLPEETSQLLKDEPSEPDTTKSEPLLKNFESIKPTNSTLKWRPTPEWVKDYKSTLPLQTTLRMIEVLTPQIERLKQTADSSSQPDELETIRFLQNGTLVGLLPVPHPILMRKYQRNEATTLWFKTCTWGIIYVRNTIWLDSDIKLIRAV